MVCKDCCFRGDCQCQQSCDQTVSVRAIGQKSTKTQRFYSRAAVRKPLILKKNAHSRAQWCINHRQWSTSVASEWYRSGWIQAPTETSGVLWIYWDEGLGMVLRYSISSHHWTSLVHFVTRCSSPASIKHQLREYLQFQRLVESTTTITEVCIGPNCYWDAHYCCWNRFFLIVCIKINIWRCKG